MVIVFNSRMRRCLPMRCLLVVAVAAAWVPPAARRAPFAVRPRTHPLPRHPRAGKPATHARRAVVLRPHEDWATWALLSGAGAFGLWAEERSQLGAALSSNVVTMLAALALVNLKLLPSASPVYGVVYYWLVPVAVAALLLDADLDRVLREGRALLAPYAAAVAATIVGTLVAWRVAPLAGAIPNLHQRATMAAALAGRHIGGAINYVAVADVGGAAPDLVAAGIAADNCVVAPFFVALFALGGPAGQGAFGAPGVGARARRRGGRGDDAARTPAAQRTPAGGVGANDAARAIAWSFACVAAGSAACERLGLASSALLPATTVATVAVATALPGVGAALAPAGRLIGVVAMQLFVGAIGASGELSKLATAGAALAKFSLAQLAVHLAVLFGAKKAFGMEKRKLAVASNAAVGGPTTAAAMAAAKKWDDLVLPGLLVGILGYATGTFLALGLRSVLIKLG